MLLYTQAYIKEVFRDNLKDFNNKLHAEHISEGTLEAHLEEKSEEAYTELVVLIRTKNLQEFSAWEIVSENKLFR